MPGAAQRVPALGALSLKADVGQNTAQRAQSSVALHPAAVDPRALSRGRRQSQRVTCSTSANPAQAPRRDSALQRDRESAEHRTSVRGSNAADKENLPAGPRTPAWAATRNRPIEQFQTSSQRKPVNGFAQQRSCSELRAGSGAARTPYHPRGGRVLDQRSWSMPWRQRWGPGARLSIAVQLCLHMIPSLVSQGKGAICLAGQDAEAVFVEGKYHKLCAERRGEQTDTSPSQRAGGNVGNAGRVQLHTEDPLAPRTTLWAG